MALFDNQTPTPSEHPHRYFTNHYLCPHCPNEWADEMLVIGPSYCPSCDAKCEPYSSEEHLDETTPDTNQFQAPKGPLPL